MRAYEFLQESSDTLELPDINVDDEVKVGRFKNRKATVKGFKKDDHGQPVLKTTKGDQKLFKPRISKLEPKKKVDEQQGEGLDRVWLDHPRFGKETIGEFLSRHNIPVDSKGMVTLYHGRPKSTQFDVLRDGSYITDDKEGALHFAARDRELKPNEVEVLTLYLTPDQIQPGVHLKLIGDYKLENNILYERTLYHGTSKKRAQSIEKIGIVPDIGDFVKQMYDEEPEIEDLVFATDKNAMSKAVTSMMTAIEHDQGRKFHDVEEDDIGKYGAIVVIKDGDEDFEQRDDDDENYYGEHPSTVEPGDYYSRHAIQVDYILTGKRLISFLRKHDFWPIPYPMFDSPRSNREQLIRLGKKMHPERRDDVVDKVMSLSDEAVKQTLKSYREQK